MAFARFDDVVSRLTNSGGKRAEYGTPPRVESGSRASICAVKGLLPLRTIVSQESFATAGGGGGERNRKSVSKT